MSRTRLPFKIYFTKRLIIIGLFGFSSGLPLLLTMSTLSWWLAKTGIDKKTIGMFSLTALPYGYKFLWSPIVDRMKLPYFTKFFGRRRGWLLFSQIALALSILLMGTANPLEDIMPLALFSILVSFWSATQDIVIDAYRIESLEKPEYAAGAAMEVNGYRMGMMVAGAGALTLSDHLSWNFVYGIMALMMLVGIVTTLFCPEIGTKEKAPATAHRSYWAWLKETYTGPFLDFMRKPGWVLILLFIFLYKLGDSLIGPMATVFYKELGFTGTEIGTAAKGFGIWMTILGSFFVGTLAYKFGIMKSLFISGIVHLASNFMFFVLAKAGHDLPTLYAAIALENASNGMMNGAFVAYLSILCSLEYTATQYALLSSFMAQSRILTQSVSGWVATHTEWTEFFWVAILTAVPGLMLLLYLMRRYPLAMQTLEDKSHLKD